jgi:hypothetical protein
MQSGRQEPVNQRSSTIGSNIVGDILYNLAVGDEDGHSRQRILAFAAKRYGPSTWRYKTGSFCSGRGVLLGDWKEILTGSPKCQVACSCMWPCTHWYLNTLPLCSHCLAHCSVSLVTAFYDEEDGCILCKWCSQCHDHIFSWHSSVGLAGTDTTVTFKMFCGSFSSFVFSLLSVTVCYFLPYVLPLLFFFIVLCVFSLLSLLCCRVLASLLAKSSHSFWTCTRNLIWRLLFALAYIICRELMKSVGKLR